MKKIVFAALFATQATLFASGGILLPKPTERVLVREIRQSVNSMPTTSPIGNRAHTTLEVDVISNGCTRAEDFVVRATPASVTTLNQQKISIFRARPDVCDGLAHRQTVTLQSDAVVPVNHVDTVVANPVLGDVSEVF